MQLTMVEGTRRATFADMNCSVAESLEVIGEWWTPLILRDAFMGVRRFEQFQTRLGIARNVLASRLDSLVEHGILKEVQYQDRPVRFEYVLTSKAQNSGRCSPCCAKGVTSGSRRPAHPSRRCTRRVDMYRTPR